MMDPDEDQKDGNLSTSDFDAILRENDFKNKLKRVIAMAEEDGYHAQKNGFGCKYCGEKFAGFAQRKEHVKIKHRFCYNLVFSSNYQCHTCSRTFISFDSFKKHLKLHGLLLNELPTPLTSSQLRVHVQKPSYTVIRDKPENQRMSSSKISKGISQLSGKVSAAKNSRRVLNMNTRDYTRDGNKNIPPLNQRNKEPQVIEVITIWDDQVCPPPSASESETHPEPLICNEDEEKAKEEAAQTLMLLAIGGMEPIKPIIQRDDEIIEELLLVENNQKTFEPLEILAETQNQAFANSINRGQKRKNGNCSKDDFYDYDTDPDFQVSPPKKKKHQYVEKRSHSCPKCSLTFDYITSLGRHFNICSKSPPLGNEFMSHRCPQSDCDRVFLTKRLLNYHITRNHSYELKKFECDLCNSRFTEQRSVFRHKYSVHNIIVPGYTPYNRK